MQPPDLKMTKLHSYWMRFFGVKIRSNFPRLSSESPIVNDSGARLTPATGTTSFLLQPMRKRANAVKRVDNFKYFIMLSGYSFAKIYKKSGLLPYS